MQKNLGSSVFHPIVYLEFSDSTYAPSQVSPISSGLGNRSQQSTKPGKVRYDREDARRRYNFRERLSRSRGRWRAGCFLTYIHSKWSIPGVRLSPFLPNHPSSRECYHHRHHSNNADFVNDDCYRSAPERGLLQARMHMRLRTCMHAEKVSHCFPTWLYGA